jgi:hypothetical protein
MLVSDKKNWNFQVQQTLEQKFKAECLPKMVITLLFASE